MEISGTQLSAWMVVAIAAATALCLSYTFSMVASRSNLLPDKPNHRSSHSKVTPRSGGLAIMGGWMAAMFLIIGFSNDAQNNIFLMTLLGFGVAIAIAGFVDDRSGLPPSVKFGLQGLGAIAFVLLLGGFESMPIPFVGLVPLGPFGILVGALWIVGFVNVFNFMDGADGLAGVAAVIVLSAFSVAAAGLGAPVIAIASMVLVFAIGGFLRVNFPYGRLFMGDSGSQSVGFLIAGFAILGARAEGSALSAIFVATAMTPFLFDTLFTLAHRLIRRQDVTSAHREHLYQLLMRHGYSHIRVTSIYAMLTAVSTAIAIFMMHAPPSAQWGGPLLVSLLMIGPAISILLQSSKAGFLTADSSSQLQSVTKLVRALRAKQKKSQPVIEDEMLGDLEEADDHGDMIVPARQTA